MTPEHYLSLRYYDRTANLSKKAVGQKIEGKFMSGWFDKAHFSNIAESGIV